MRARVDVGGELLPGLVSQNVIGHTQPLGGSDGEIIICSHHDSTYNSPGAFDNATGVSAMLHIAEEFQRKMPGNALKFISFGCEEYRILGSRYYVDRLKERGGTKRIKTVVCLDGLGVGRILRVWVAHEQLRNQIRNSLGSLKMQSDLTMSFEDPEAGSDHWPFHEEGIPTVFLTCFGGLETKEQEDYHSPTDTYEKIDGERFEDAVEVGNRIIDFLSAR